MTRELFNKTTLRKSYHGGWLCETLVKEGETLWEVTTMKRYNKKLTTVAHKLESYRVSENAVIKQFSWDSECECLGATEKRATKKAVIDQHCAAVNGFLEAA